MIIFGVNDHAVDALRYALGIKEEKPMQLKDLIQKYGDREVNETELEKILLS